MQETKVQRSICISKRLRGLQSVQEGKKECLEVVADGFGEEGGKD